jgi:hypothetical protein
MEVIYEHPIVKKTAPSGTIAPELDARRKERARVHSRPLGVKIFLTALLAGAWAWILGIVWLLGRFVEWLS